MDSRHPHRSDPRDRIVSWTKELSRLRYDWDGVRGLPMRDDVYRIIMVLFNSGHLPDSLFAHISIESVLLNRDGTVSMYFVGSTERHVMIEFPCEGIIRYTQIFPDTSPELSTVEGEIRYTIDNGSKTWFIDFDDAIIPKIVEVISWAAWDAGK